MAVTKVLKLVFVSAVALADAASHNVLDAGIVSEKDAAHSLEAELLVVDSGRMRSVQDALRTTFQALPKNAYGNLGHEAVRYALHRMFIQRHGWFIKGLEPGSDRGSAAPRAGEVPEWVPSYLQSMLETKLGERGANLHDLAAFAASLEDLIDSEARGRLAAAYEMLEFPKDGSISEDQARQVVKVYYISFLLSGNFSADSRWEAERKVSLFTQRYTDWEPAERWMQELMAPTFAAKLGGGFSFDEVARMVEDIGESYYKFNDLECRQLKGMLGELEGIKAGRVRLSFFYQKGLHSHWRFNEKPDYLRVLGALDDSEPATPQVIVPNYVMARPNCLEASNLYAICCRNECEDLLGSLEQQIGSHVAEPTRITELVAAMSSDSVRAPRTLPATLVSRLDEVAASNDGKVPLHGRLFAQWMHHAFPRECPFPHEAGSNPQTPDEWMASQGDGAQEMSREEMMKTVEADQCASGLTSGRLPRPEDCGSPSGHELPWMPREELLVSGRQVEEGSAVVRPVPVLDVVGIIGLIVFLSYRLQQARHGRGSFKVKDDRADNLADGHVVVQWRGVFAFGALATVAFVFDLLDGIVFGCALLGSIGSIAIQLKAKEPFSSGVRDDFSSKCHV